MKKPLNVEPINEKLKKGSVNDVMVSFLLQYSVLYELLVHFGDIVTIFISKFYTRTKPKIRNKILLFQCKHVLPFLLLLLLSKWLSSTRSIGVSYFRLYVLQLFSNPSCNIFFTIPRFVRLVSTIPLSC